MGKTVTLMGIYGTGKRSMISAFTGIKREKLIENSRMGRWISQIKERKDEITLQGLPEEHGRISAYRQRTSAISKSDAFIIVVRNKSPSHYKHFHELVAEVYKDNPEATMGPFMIIAGYTSFDEGEPVDPALIEWALSINAKIELLNVEKLSGKDETETQKLDSIIRSFVASTETEPIVAPAQESEENPQQPAVLEAGPVVALTQELEEIPQLVSVLGKIDNPEFPAAKPQPTKLARALTYLTRGGSVA